MASQAHNRQGYYPVDVDNAKIQYLPVAATQTFAKGDAVILSTGLVAIAVAGSAVLLGVAAERSVLQATGTLVPVYTDPDTVFEGVQDADSSSVVAGDEVDLIGATGAMMLDTSESTTDVFKMVAGNPEDTLATARARWRFTINKHAYAQID